MACNVAPAAPTPRGVLIHVLRITLRLGLEVLFSSAAHCFVYAHHGHNIRIRKIQIAGDHALTGHGFCSPSGRTVPGQASSKAFHDHGVRHVPADQQSATAMVHWPDPIDRNNRFQSSLAFVVVSLAVDYGHNKGAEPAFPARDKMPFPNRPKGLELHAPSFRQIQGFQRTGGFMPVPARSDCPPSLATESDHKLPSKFISGSGVLQKLIGF